MVEYNILFKQIEGSDKLSYTFATVMGSALNKKIGEVSPEAGEFLHNRGYQGEHRNFKLLTHRLRPREYETTSNAMVLKGDKLIGWSIRFFDRNLAKVFEKSLLMNPVWELGDDFGHRQWEVVKSDLSRKPLFKPVMKYSLITPAPITKRNEKTGKSTYLVYKNQPEQVLEQIKKNIRNKAVALYNFGMAGDGFEEGLEDLDIRILGNARASGLVFKKSQPKPVPGNLFDFELIAPVEVQKLIYYGGFMGKTAMGCGYLKVI
ncbi:CRISPR-associated endoribonuclease Cas6 [Aureibacter tunicatorum]|uniref:CRISPR-associated endoribonuclease Cas6 n=1 Tax=Aureibacter tunicatorum TaxID=866807 RepID=A0AAE3XSH4_9BACT|nr:CRISPR-associated endoribonuclease Cas6 [Aureibacter tunicatorum]MDR6241938.1 CRISPR-associated endoribonuclease Cas6 [Aureibacter tunicatorum]BDD07544.1 hypothetical protein AUTU_50270 [Aureibacter tunicatorum]